MFGISSFAFVSPWFLAPLLGLPILWWLLRVTPPPPKQVVFPAVRLLAELETEEETPARTPWWLLLLRLLIAALVLIALAQPLLNPGVRLNPSGGPVIVVIDDGWAAGPGWSDRQTAMEGLLTEAERANRPVRILTTAPAGATAPPLLTDIMPAVDALTLVRALEPKPWPIDRAAALAALEAIEVDGPVDVFWISDGLAGSDVEAYDFADALQKIGPVDVIGGSDAPAQLSLKLGDEPGPDLVLVARRPAVGAAVDIWALATTGDNRIVARQKLRFEAAEFETRAVLQLPTETRNQLARLEIEGEASAAAAVLIDERWRQRPVGLISGTALEDEQPLLAPLYYIERALKPTTELRRGEIRGLLARPLAVIMMADVGRIVGPDKARLEAWIDGGGVLLRFAGPRMAEVADDLTPVRLRKGGRNLGGALTWSKPASLSPFEEASPFHGLAVPDDVRVHRQVLAQPDLTLTERTWARLADGTPIVTAQKRGKGWVVLVHTSANTEWSNLPLSGLFVDMLKRVVELAHGVAPTASGGNQTALPALATLDGFGRLGDPPASVRPLMDETAPGPGLPPGYYGAPDNRRALNLGPAVDAMKPLGSLPQGVRRLGFTSGEEVDLKPALLAAAVILALIELTASLHLRGLLSGLTPRLRRRIVGGLLAALIVCQPWPQALAQTTDDEFALAASLETRLAYVLTGDSQIDRISQAGLSGLTRILSARTSVEAAEPLGIELEIDDIVFFPLLYWPITASMPALSESALAKIDGFMKSGGTILFDTRDQQAAAISATTGSGTPEGQRLRRLLGRLDIPPLTPVPPKHILTRAFYLMQAFPGRWAGGRVWVERHGGGINDGVSGLMIGANDWAAAWAMDEEGRPLSAVVPGGERQREMAYRFGVNAVMYALTGNYKADQVHVPALLERLGQ